jgi:alpha-L-rhamnosidase
MKAADQTLLDPKTGTFGSRWQTNAMAIYSGLAPYEKEAAAIWENVLSKPSPSMISPYYNYYVISAMAETGHRREALDWIRKYWGGMIQEGATSFWEGYDPSWPKKNFHANLQADDDKGYFVSLAHGWSSGPTAWLAEEILGVQPMSGGFKSVMIRPDLAGLEWVRGSVPAPDAPIFVDYKSANGLDARIDLPVGISATVDMPVCAGQNTVIVNGTRRTGRRDNSGKRILVPLGILLGGTYRLHSDCAE